MQRQIHAQQSKDSRESRRDDTPTLLSLSLLLCWRRRSLPIALCGLSIVGEKPKTRTLLWYDTQQILNEFH